MKVKIPKSNRNAAAEAVETSSSSDNQADELLSEAFLVAAKNEPKRILLMDHINTISVLRDQKHFTFRAIADWLGERGIQTDHSAVYRAYLASTPEHMRHPDQDWSEVEDPGYGDENVKIKKTAKAKGDK